MVVFWDGEHVLETGGILCWIWRERELEHFQEQGLRICNMSTRNQSIFASLHPGEMQSRSGWNELKDSALNPKPLNDCSLFKKSQNMSKVWWGRSQPSDVEKADVRVNSRCGQGGRPNLWQKWVRLDAGETLASDVPAATATEAPAAGKRWSLHRHFQEWPSSGWICQQMRWLLEVLSKTPVWWDDN